MEDTWYLFPGQTLENSKIEERGKALKGTKKAWEKMTKDHLERKQNQKKIWDKELEHKKSLKDGSADMMEHWENSLAKIRQHRLEEHDIKVKQREEDLYKRFIELRTEQKDERDKIVSNVKRRIIMYQDYSRQLNSALMLAETLDERRMQLNVQAMEREYERIEEAKYAERIRYNAEQEKIENAEKIRKRKEKDYKHAEELKHEIKERKAIVQKAKEEKVNAEIIDHARMIEEMEDIKKYEHKVDKEKKAFVVKEMLDVREIRKKQEEAAKIQDEVEDKINDLKAKLKCRVEKRRKQEDKERLQQKLDLQEKMCRKLEVNEAIKAKAVDELLEQQAKEYEEKQIKVIEIKEAEQKRLRAERIETNKRAVNQKIKKIADQREIAKLVMINRFKDNEVYEKYCQDKAQRLYDERIQFRRELDQQIKNEDNSKYIQQCKEAEIKFFKDKLDNDDKEFFDYADQVVDLAKSRGKDTKLIKRIIQNYKIDMGLEPTQKFLMMSKPQEPPVYKEIKFSKIMQYKPGF